MKNLWIILINNLTATWFIWKYPLHHVVVTSSHFHPEKGKINIFNMTPDGMNYAMSNVAYVFNEAVREQAIFNEALDILDGDTDRYPED